MRLHRNPCRRQRRSARKAARVAAKLAQQCTCKPGLQPDPAPPKVQETPRGKDTTMAKPKPPTKPAPPKKPEPPTPNPAVIERIAEIAMGEVDYHEGKTGGRWNNRTKYAGDVPGLAWADGQPWCATFMSWLALKAGAADLYPRTASCDAGGEWFKDRNRWGEYPAIGAQVFYGTPNDLSHTGLVIGFDADWITTVEGNTNANGSSEGDGVYRKLRRRRDAYVVGYGYPPVAHLVKARAR